MPANGDLRARELLCSDEDGCQGYQWVVQQATLHPWGVSWTALRSFTYHNQLVEVYPQLDTCTFGSDDKPCERTNAPGMLACQKCIDAERAERDRECSEPVTINGQLVYPDPQCGWDTA